MFCAVVVEKNGGLCMCVPFWPHTQCTCIIFQVPFTEIAKRCSQHRHGVLANSCRQDGGTKNPLEEPMLYADEVTHVVLMPPNSRPLLAAALDLFLMPPQAGSHSPAGFLGAPGTPRTHDYVRDALMLGTYTSRCFCMQRV